MGLIEDALDRQAAAPPPRHIDYERMNRIFPSQKAALTRAVKRYEQADLDLRLHATFDTRPAKDAREALAKVIKKAVAEWNEIGAWPDDWSRWQRALDDSLGWSQHIDIGAL